ncbi:hypothetical protein LWI29_024178 [Acer saccharum]|uniref:Uncharacterized protein n=1 Tax=Acer saccharum TaxID=4024 RepID=A0AA39RLI7_ACESA|nr:hypothetical protein LWI29_024178 [Acer saccharum]
MDPSLRSSLFNQMMQALELGDKRTADRIESLIRNFHPDSPTPISVFIPSSEEDFVPNIPSPSSFDSDSPMTTRSSKPGGSRRWASRAPRGSLLDAQITVDSDVDDHQKNRLHFSADHPCSFDCEINVVGEEELRKYKSRFNIPDAVTLILLGDRAAWNPPENAVAIYGAMLSCRVTLPLQPFIARFFAEAQIAPAQLAPNSYRILMCLCLCLMWKLKGYGPLTPSEIRHFYTLRQAGNSGTYFLLSSIVENWIPEGAANPGQAKRVPRHFTSLEVWSKAIPVLLDAEIAHLAAAAVLPLDERVCDFDTVCDLQARVVKNSEAASKRHAVGLAKEGIASPDGGDPSDSEEVGDVTGRGAISDIPIFDADVLETPLDPASDLAPRTGRGKRPAEGTSDSTTRPPKRASRVVQYVISSDEEGVGEHVFTEAPPTQTATHEGPAEGTNATVPPPEEPNVSSLGQPRSPGLPGPSKQPGASAFGSGVAREAPPVGSTEADEETMSLSDFLATEICLHLINHNVYIGEGWEHVKGKPCNIKMEFFFNCHSLMMSELAESYRHGNKVSREGKRLREQASILAAEKLSTEESYAQQLAQLRESADGYLSTQLAAEEKLSAAEEEIRSLKEQLSASQESLAARLEAERLAEEAKEKAKREALDLRNQLSSRDVIFDDLKAVLEVEAVDHFKRSLAYDAFFFFCANLSEA